VDEVVIVKMLVLKSWYDLSDPEPERQANDRISFRRFLGFPGKIPDSDMVWLFRERLAETSRDKLVLEKLQRQLDEKGLKVRRVSSRKSPSSWRTQVRPRSPGAATPVLGGVRMAPGRRGGRDPYSATSFTPRRMWTTA
jgi:IS5 family transposase